ncbi:hypothetical protein H2O64_17820 [Kordia sp. YSTF-M3]|uniref:Bacteriocin n=1 Tax=Kordia aestuariivivens TaxID=2759037 RepID=A0ABR7QD90_9FLAO|nr:hypothetical protein [Kordia aestuariivivens]MBC8756535.1 hypothetical protein [Kordia aestuariivivens]
MKKKSLKSLSLNKKSVSNLQKISGGDGLIQTFNDWPDTAKLCPSDVCPQQTDFCTFTCGDCINTWGDPGCITGINTLC